MLPVRSVRDLGVYINANTAMKNNVIATVKACFAPLRQIRSVRRSLPQHALLILIRALVVSKVDYCNSVLAGISSRHMDRLLSILNAAARLVFSVRKSGETITPLPREVHWLRSRERIQVRPCVLVYRYLNDTAPPYLAESLHTTTEDAARCRLRSAGTSSLLVQSTRRATLGDRAFYVAVPPRLWNTLLTSVSTAASLLIFRRNLKMLLFQLSLG